MGRVVLALATAAILIGCLATWHGTLLRAHDRLCVTLLSVSGIPLHGTETVMLFPGLSPAPVPVTPVIRLSEHPTRIAILFGVVLLGMSLLHRYVPLAQGFVLFLVALLFLSALVAVFFPAMAFTAAQFAQIWLRGEILVWFVLPLFSAATVIVIHPAGVLGIASTLLLQAYAIAWSAVRLAFFIGIMHFSGSLFAPLLWFAFGLLADMVYLMVFYSLAIRWIASRAWGRRAS